MYIGFLAPDLQYESLGCWKSRGDELISSLENIVQQASVSDPVLSCSEALWERGVTMFGMDGDGRCGVFNNGVKYDHYCSYDDCQDGTGIGVNVYQIKGKPINT